MVQRSGRGEIVNPSRVVAAIDAFRRDILAPLTRRLPIAGPTADAVNDANAALRGLTAALETASDKVLKARGLALPG